MKTMSRSYRIVRHRDHDVLINDYEGLSGELFAELVRENTARIVASGRTDLRLVIHMPGAFVDRQTLTEFKNAAVAVRPMVHQTAVVGVDGVQRFLLEVVNRFSGIGGRPFDTLAEALDWLTELPKG
jgi:hypothetical protein